LASRYLSSGNDIAEQEVKLSQLIDQRIFVENDEALAQMFLTITVQLDIAAILEAMAAKGLADIHGLYHTLRQALSHELNSLQKQDIDTSFARDYLLKQEHQPVKYLLSSGSLLSKAKSGAADVNKFYGLSAPNFLHQDFVNKYGNKQAVQLSESAETVSHLTTEAV